ncbi:GNAT family N-acetyltransferase [Saccharopolyspora cebuensis]|uniref:GNAT family N-acetyltransferase n=1 Tax=Saccharopolyspora cebuensis TaxID=418759 RepID=A0ABV4CUJ6_9PSEU
MTMIPERPTSAFVGAPPGPDRDRPDGTRIALRPQPCWVGRAVRLRVIESDDRRTLMRFDREGDPGLVEGYRHWAAHRANHRRCADDFQLGIETLAGGRLVGSMCTTQTEPGAGRFSYGIGVGPEFQRHGYACDAIGILLRYMFEHRRYLKCEVGIYGHNVPSLRLHRKIGFREEQHEPHVRARYLVLMGITRAEWAGR